MLKTSLIIIILCFAFLPPQMYAESLILKDPAIQQALPVIKEFERIILELYKISGEITDNYLYSEHISDSDKENLRIIRDLLDDLSKVFNWEQHTLVLLCLMKEKYKPEFFKDEHKKTRIKTFELNRHSVIYRNYRTRINNPAAFKLIDSTGNIILKQLPALYNQLEQFYGKYNEVK